MKREIKRGGALFGTKNLYSEIMLNRNTSFLKVICRYIFISGLRKNSFCNRAARQESAF